MNNSTTIEKRNPNSTFDDFDNNCGLSTGYIYNREVVRYAKKHKISEEKAFDILYKKKDNRRGKQK